MDWERIEGDLDAYGCAVILLRGNSRGIDGPTVRGDRAELLG